VIRTKSRDSFVDLLWVLAILIPWMWLLRALPLSFMETVYGFILSMSVPIWRLRVRGLTWKDVGVVRPESLQSLANATVAIFVLTLVLSALASLSLQSLGYEPDPRAVNRFEGIEGNLPYFLFVLMVVWVASFSEEFIFRGLLLQWFERVLGGTNFSLVLAVLLQAGLSVYLHYDSHGMLGAYAAGGRALALGIGFVAFKRNLWPVVLVHAALNTVSYTEIFLDG